MWCLLVMIDLLVVASLGACALYVCWGGFDGRLKTAGPSIAEIQFAIMKHFLMN